MNIAEIERNIFSDLGSDRRLQLYHNSIYKLCGLVIDFVDCDGKDLQIFPRTHFWPLCRRLRFSAEKDACQCHIRQCLRSARLQKKMVILQCHAGLHEMVLPLFDNRGEYIGSMITGQFQYEPNPNFKEAQIQKIAEEYRCNGDELWFFYTHSPRLTATQLDGICDIMADMGSFIIESRNHMLFLEKINAPERINLIKQYIADNYQRPLTLPEIARKFFLSPSQFSRTFKRYTGVSFVSYLNLLRCSKAEALLRNSSLDISEISIHLGFGSTSQFYRHFKQINKISPEQFRLKEQK